MKTYQRKERRKQNQGFRAVVSAKSMKDALNETAARLFHRVLPGSM
jgi:hypothetical protein